MCVPNYQIWKLSKIKIKIFRQTQLEEVKQKKKTIKKREKESCNVGIVKSQDSE